MLVRDYQEQHGLTDDELAERLGRDVRGVRGMKNREIPRGWAEQLGVDFDVQAAAAERDRLQASAKPRREHDTEPPRPHDPDAVRPTPGPPLPATTDTSAAQERIAAVYSGVGFAVSTRSGNPGYAAVTDDQAPALARAWVKAAEENELARRVVALMGSGGAGGELVMAHVVWIMGLAYVSGRSDLDPLGSYARKYGRYRPYVRVPADGEDRPPEEDRARDGHPGPAAPVG